jgi:mannose/cellobiose epimerase-like protein (N-acyl-D-glucosamine 2-epimerase family)
LNKPDIGGRLRQWATERALPLWAEAGFDTEHGRFRELLTLQGEPIHDTPHRLIVQGRQIHTYAVAQKRGWYRAGDKIEQAYRSMLRDYRRGRHWSFSIHRNGDPCDPRRDFYAHAFVLLAIGSLVGLTGDRAPLAVADELLACLDTDFAAVEGHLEALPATDLRRRQNPHMHLFEALLNLWMNTRDPRYLERAGKMFDLFARRFFDPQAGVLLEYFDEALAPAPERIVEPGHHCEWAWLLRWYQRETGTPVEHYVEPLLAHVERYGIDRAGLLPDELLADGTVRTASRRTWPMTEAIKAFAVHGRHERASALSDRLHEHFLSGVVPGGWMDRLDAEGRPAADNMPASTLYHVMGIVLELDPT